MLRTFRCRLLEYAGSSGAGTLDLVMGLGVLPHLDERTGRQLARFAKVAVETGRTNAHSRSELHARQSAIRRFVISKDRGQRVESEAGTAHWHSDICNHRWLIDASGEDSLHTWECVKAGVFQ